MRLKVKAHAEVRGGRAIVVIEFEDDDSIITVEADKGNAVRIAVELCAAIRSADELEQEIAGKAN